MMPDLLRMTGLDKDLQSAGPADTLQPQYSEYI
jgi:hypothetical protein